MAATVRYPAEPGFHTVHYLREFGDSKDLADNIIWSQNSGSYFSSTS